MAESTTFGWRRVTKGQRQCSVFALKFPARTLITSVGADEIIDISDHVEIVGGSTLPYLQREAGEALIAAIGQAGRTPQLVHALRTFGDLLKLMASTVHTPKANY